MITVLPNGYLTILEAAEVLSRTIYAGVPDLPIVSKLRKNGLDVRDGQATDRAIAELWKAVDKGMLRALVIGGRPRRILRLSPELTKVIPFLRSPRGRGFTHLCTVLREVRLRAAVHRAPCQCTGTTMHQHSAPGRFEPSPIHHWVN